MCGIHSKTFIFVNGAVFYNKFYLLDQYLLHLMYSNIFRGHTL